MPFDRFRHIADPIRRGAHCRDVANHHKSRRPLPAAESRRRLENNLRADSSGVALADHDRPSLSPRRHRLIKGLDVMILHQIVFDPAFEAALGGLGGKLVANLVDSRLVEWLKPGLLMLLELQDMKPEVTAHDRRNIAGLE